MELRSYPSASAFLRDVQPWLAREEVHNSLMLGIASRVASAAQTPENPPYFAAVLDGASVVFAALMTPPYRVVVCGEEAAAPEAIHLLLTDLREKRLPVPGVIGRTWVATQFAQAWAREVGEPAERTRDERLYALERVQPVSAPGGTMRAATPNDVPTLVPWLRTFHDEANPDNPIEDPWRVARRGIDNGRLFVWDAPGPVSMAGISRRTGANISIAPVYTPTEYRNRGYGTALVAALSQRLLDAGHTTCCLFADLANPVSNHIYQKIGFRKVCDFAEITFGRGE